MTTAHGADQEAWKTGYLGGGIRYPGATFKKTPSETPCISEHPIYSAEYFKPAWRPDIEGLRGLAILAVLIFHAVPSWLPGGFIGVDMFFVLSGFVVGRGVVAELAEGTFSYEKFYARRIRRIFPALVVVLVSVLAIAPFFVGHEDYEALGKQVAATTVFAANFLAWSQSGYFDGEAAYRPLIHLWSLGVEEQFYGLLPVSLLFLFKRYRKNTVSIVAIAAGVSFVCCIVITRWDGNAAFYLPFTRFWELLAGTLLALREHGKPAGTHSGAKELVSLIGFCFLLSALFLLEESQFFPGWQAAFPVCGTVFILIAGPCARINQAILSRGFFTWMGKVSYAAYLWHWPALVFARYSVGNDPSIGLSVCLVLFSVFFAWLSTRFVEAPFRSGKWSRNGNVVKALFIALMFVGVSSVAITHLSRGGAPTGLTRLENYPMPGGDIWREGRGCFANLNRDTEFGADCLGGNANGTPLLALWGDSHAAHLWPGLSTEAPIHHWRLAQLTVSQCPPLISGAGEGNNKCQIMRDRALDAIRRIKPEAVVLASRWTLYRHDAVLDAIRPTIRALRSMGVSRVIVIGPFPRWQPTLAKALASDMRKRHLLEPPRYTDTGFDESIFAFDGELKRAVVGEGADFISALDAMCREQGKCKVWVDEESKTTLTTYDGGHLAIKYSGWFANKISERLFPSASNIMEVHPELTDR